ncbi:MULTISPECIES: BapA/Bap/LapF family large adhesin [unclassified Pseudomonas]|uniref:BapA/Bap/LapF family large adhesin n=1 Tax=unclassified Pseudomonas TaxID=196821 RepID=UPI000BDB98B6|nr:MULTISPECIES: BapA/Bap/LapF family large adhesin [unclassified Pseudomonas]PVZ13589.1 hypothetical protein F474_02671 [Pseudomonas sp. URIL14HWK12:I12]PVZ23895.1 hypothetical protein F470_02326 [Pseudomonas sp. URIL14HWK12:I10]PVZ33466.1 hypothetical protein F472_02936 [Pseudomonas sp. URIL14HWK12:I11]SNZ11664.1 hypothetical protein SAMN05660463_01921 [Pseudomonas sp. URIL14HWK12:I9]
MDNIVVADKASEQITENVWGNVNLNAPGVVRIPAAPQQVTSVARSGQNLVVTLKSGEQTTLGNFFATSPQGVGSDIVFEGEDGALWQGTYDAEAFNGLTFEQIGSIDELIAGAGVVGSATPTWAIAGLGALGAGGTAAAAGGLAAGGGGNNNGPAGVGVDLQAPDAPSDLALSIDGLTLTGRGEIGATVNVRDAFGNLIGTAVVGSDGRFQVSLSTAQLNGQSLQVNVTDAAGNTSADAQITAPGSGAAVVASATDLAISGDGSLLSGRGQVGAQVRVYDANGVQVGTGTVGADGTFTLRLQPSQLDGQALQVSLGDNLGNVSANTQINSPDLTPPASPGSLALSADGLHLTGTSFPGFRILIRTASGRLIGQGRAGVDGRFDITLDSPQLNGQYLSISASDTAGNSSAPATLQAADSTAPGPVSDLLITPDGSSVSGQGEPGATVTITDANGALIGTGTVQPNGTFNVPVTTPVAPGQAVNVSQQDPSGNASSPLTSPPASANTPEAPSGAASSADGTRVTGSAPAGATVQVIDASGNVIGTGTADGDGRFDITLTTPQIAGSTVDVVVVGSGNQTSPAVPITTPDLTAPLAPSDVLVSANGSLVTGRGEVGATVTVTGANGAVLGTAIVDPAGGFAVALNSPQIDGQPLTVTQADAAGNTSPATVAPAPDLDGPLALAAISLDAAGLALTGVTQAGAQVTVTASDGTVLGTAGAGADGRFSVNLNSAQINGQLLQVSASNAAGASTQASYAAADTQPPAPVSNLAIDGAGAVITGQGEPGANVRVLSANGTLLGSATVQADGGFSVTLPQPQLNGQALSLVQADAAGNLSNPANLAAPDTQAPAAPRELLISADGLVVSGRGEPGTTAQVRAADNTLLGTVQVAGDGTFSLVLGSPRVTGERLSVTHTDAAGNVSPAVTVTTPDLTSPPAPSGLAVANGVLTGTGEPGANVIVYGPGGQVLGSGQVAPGGSFSVTLVPAQANGELISVQLTDTAGNRSPLANLNAPDTTAPLAPQATISADGSLVTGTGEPGTTVTVSLNGQSLGTAVVASNGSFTLTLATPQVAGQALLVNLADGAGNASPGTGLSAPDLTGPAAPSSLLVVNAGATVTGVATAGALVEVRDLAGNLIGSATAGPQGLFSVAIAPAQANGEALEVRATLNGQSASAEVTAPDTTPPALPSALAISADGLSLSGLAEPGSTVQVRDTAGGPVLATAVAAADGTFVVALPSAPTIGATLLVNALDVAGNSSADASAAYSGNAASAPTALVVSADGFSVTGLAAAGISVTVYGTDGSPLGSATAGPDGRFSVLLRTAQLNGERLHVNATDATGAASPSAVVQAGDSTAPSAATALALNAAGTQLTGHGEPGATVTVLGADGSSLGSALVGANGLFTVNLASAQLNGQTLRAVLADTAGNLSPASALTAPDLTPPPAPANLAFSSTGMVLSGTGEPGAVVTVTNAAGSVVAQGNVDASGNFQVTLQNGQLTGAPVAVTLTDAAGNTSPASPINTLDRTAPDALTQVALNATGSTLTGLGEPNATVTVRDDAGNVLGTATVGSDGRFTLTLTTAQANGQPLVVSQADTAGNTSVPVNLVAPDITAPAALSNLALNSNGTQFSGYGEPGATVTVRSNDGLTVLGTGTVNSDGSFSLALNPAQLNGQVLSARQADAAGNLSPDASFTAPDLTPPAVPSAALAPNGLQVSGQAEPGSTVQVRSVSGALLGSAVAASDGSYQLTLNAAQLNGERLSVTATDAAGNTSPAQALTAPDTTAPAAVTQLALSADGVTVSGFGEPGATITVRSASGALLGTAVAGSAGQFSVLLGSAPAASSQLSVTATDPAGNSSAAANLAVPDAGQQVPATPSALLLSADGLALSGRADPGTTVTVHGPGGALLGRAEVAADGTFTVNLSSAQLDGQSLAVSASDATGLNSPSAGVNAPDTTAPAPLTNLALSYDGLVVTGRGEPGARVTITGAGGHTLAVATVAADGAFSATLDSAQLNGQVLSLQQADAANNESLSVSLTAADRTAPDAPTQLAVSGDGLVLTGNGEPGTTATVRDSAGNSLGTAVVRVDGGFEVNLTSPQANAQTLSVTLTDAAGNASPAQSVQASDTTAPSAVTNVGISADGLTLTGRGEPGATVTVRDAAGNSLGTATVAGNGTFSAQLNSAQVNGETLSVVQADPTGNVSVPAVFSAPDTAPPAALTQVAISANGALVTGLGEAGATVTVKTAAGVLLGSTVVLANGTFSVALVPAQINQQVLTVQQADPPGNVSVPSQVTAPDLTPPAAALNLQLAAGTTLTGTGEAGTLVRVTSASGALLGSGTVAANGAFSITLSSPQTNGQSLLVTLADPSNNLSPNATLVAADTTPPALAANLSLASTGLLLSGQGEAGARVTVTSASGVVLGTGTVGADGSFNVALNSAQLNGQRLSVILQDAAGNPSPAATLVATDVTAPLAPTALAVTNGGATLTGNGEAGATVTVRNASGAVLGSAQVGTDGSFSVSLAPTQANGQVLSLTQTDAAGNVSLPGSVTAPDTTAPNAAGQLSLTADLLGLAGTGEVGATVTVRSGTTVLGTGIVDANGNFLIALQRLAQGNEQLQVRLTDTAGNVSAAANLTVPTIAPPASPTGLSLSANGLVLTGSASAGTTVNVYSADNTLLGSTVAGVGNTFSVSLGSAQLNGQALHVVASLNGASSAPGLITAVDITAPAIVTQVLINATGTQVTGRGEAGATVTLRSASNAVLGTATVGADGTFSASLDPAQANGQPITVVQQDAAGNLSTGVTLTAPDLTPPALPTGLVLNAAGTLLAGSGEVGATARVYSAAGTLLGTAVVGANGQFSAPLNTPQTNGQVLTVRLTDVAGNTSAGASFTAPDTTAPAAPGAVQISTSGTQVSGTGEVGARVNVRNAAGTLLGSGTVAADGTFAVALGTAQVNLQVLNVTLTDAANNVSAASTVTAPDLTPPALATALAVSTDGLVLTGSGEAGATVTVKSPTGTVLGTATVASNGSFSVALNAAQLKGQTLNVTLTDSAGNASAGAAVVAPNPNASLPVTATDNLAQAEVTLTPVTARQSYSDSFTAVINVGFTQYYNFSIASGTTAHPVLTLTSGNSLGLLNGSTFSLQVKNAAGAWVTVASGNNSSLLQVSLLAGGTAVQANLATLQAGDYRIALTSGGLNVATTVASQLQVDVTSLTQFTGAPTAVSGNLVTDPGVNGQADSLGPDQSATVSVLKGGTFVAAGSGTTVQGLYGTLTIDGAGNYTYSPTGTASSVGKVDTFTYELVHSNGLVSTARLYVRIDSPQATETWSSTDLSANATVVDATNDVTSSALTLIPKEIVTSGTLGTQSVLLGGSSATYNTSVAAGTTGDLTIGLSSANLLSLLGSVQVQLYQQVNGSYQLVRTISGSSLVALGTNTYGITLPGQVAGNYQIKVTTGGIGLVTSLTTTLTNTATVIGQFVVGSATVASGNLLTDIAGAGPDVTGSPFTTLSVLAAGNFVLPGYNGVSVAGTYGTLLVQADGSYTYTLNPGLASSVIGRADTFTYELTHPNGTTDTATLTVNLTQAGASTFAALAIAQDNTLQTDASLAAAGSDTVLQGTAGNDTLDPGHGGAVTLQGGAGNDTLVVHDQQFANVDGGSGTDTLLWAGGDAVIDLGNLADRIHNIEIIDLNDTSRVDLTLSLTDLIKVTDSGNNTLLIKGGSLDSVHMTGIWNSDGGTHLADGVSYTQYTPQEDPTHHLWVQNGVQVV